MIRGVAAVQVVFLHLASAYWPEWILAPSGSTGATWRATPLFVPFDGYSAVFLFFGLSGFVLTRAWSGDSSVLPVVVGRYLRLALPALAACLLAWVAMRLFGHPNLRAGEVLASSWLQGSWDLRPNLPDVFRDGLLDAPLLGYDGAGYLSKYDWPGPELRSLTRAWVPLLWTLSLEFQGAMLVLALVRLRQSFPRLWLPAVAGLLVVLVRSAFLCFLLGHLLSFVSPGRAPGAARTTATKNTMAIPLLGLLLVSLGAWIGVLAEGGVAAAIGTLCRAELPALPCLSVYQCQKMTGGMLEFLGLVLAFGGVAVRRPILLALGRWSFPLYLGHWPGVVAAGAATYLLLQPVLGEVPARLMACVTALAWTAMAVALLLRADGFAQSLSRVLRGRPRRVGEGGAGHPG
ncbi:acyltransferase family protein [Roseomonas elaeocarpi]|uniref:Acyltransferase family protein n=1 Tax=Roseomonas elaeocarpi TaxID=907779 RepID=A0ABV6JUX2_9PROT